MWEEKIFSNGDVTSGKLQDFIAEEYIGENGKVDYEEAVSITQNVLNALNL